MGTPARLDLIETKDSDGNDIDLRISKGSDYRITLEHDDDDIETAYGAGNTLESLGFTAKAQIRETERMDSTLIAEFAVTISDNDIILSLTDTDTDPDTIERMNGYYDVKVTDDSDFTEPWYEGEVEFKNGPTDISA